MQWELWSANTNLWQHYGFNQVLCPNWMFLSLLCITLLLIRSWNQLESDFVFHVIFWFDISPIYKQSIREQIRSHYWALTGQKWFSWASGAEWCISTEAIVQSQYLPQGPPATSHSSMPGNRGPWKETQAQLILKNTSFAIKYLKVSYSFNFANHLQERLGGKKHEGHLLMYVKAPCKLYCNMALINLIFK